MRIIDYIDMDNNESGSIRVGEMPTVGDHLEIDGEDYVVVTVHDSVTVTVMPIPF